jgi:predicted transcriptional regulator
MSYLTSKQRLIWTLNSNGLTESGIARKLFVTRQTVHHALNAANQKIGQSLQETANINKIEIETLDIAKGFLIGYSEHFKTRAFITFSAKNGIQIWYEHEGDCEKCGRLKKCEEVLLEEIRDRKSFLQDQSSQMLPSKLAKILFSAITEGKKDGHS